MASPTQWTWVWASSGSWWRTAEPGMLQSMGSHSVGQDWVTEQQQIVIWRLLWSGSGGLPLVASLVTQTVKNLPAMKETWVHYLGWENPLEKEVATHSSILAWIIPWTEELGRLQSMGWQRVGHDWMTNSSSEGLMQAKDWLVLTGLPPATWLRILRGVETVTTKGQ